MNRNAFFYTAAITVILGFSIIASIIIYILKPPLGGIQVQLKNSAWLTIQDGTNVLFDTVLNDKSDNISYNSTTGEFTIKKPGNYYIYWSLSTEGAGSSQTISATIKMNGISYSEESSLAVPGVFPGKAFVTVVTTPAVITLVNSTGNDILLSNVLVQGNIVITEASN